MIRLYTDGACKGNPGSGGWAAVIVENGAKRTVCGHEESSTNNRMEVLAAIRGLESLPELAQVTVVSDSSYLVNTMTKNWKRKRNLDLWGRLDDEVRKRTVDWEWVKGHAGHPLNEEADALASKMASGTPTSVGGLTHLDEKGSARMVDVGDKPESERVAVARAEVAMNPETIEMIYNNKVRKGDVLSVARIAGIMGAKNTSQLIPLCHPLPLSEISIDFQLDDTRTAVRIRSRVKTFAKTGVEMEALVAASLAALTIYDMCKAVDKTMCVGKVRLIRKTGGQSGDTWLE